MAQHKLRTGKLFVSYECKQQRHGAFCDNFIHQLDDAFGRPPIVCHCDCHPVCSEHGSTKGSK